MHVIYSLIGLPLLLPHQPLQLTDCDLHADKQQWQEEGDECDWPYDDSVDFEAGDRVDADYEQLSY